MRRSDRFPLSGFVSVTLTLLLCSCSVTPLASPAADPAPARRPGTSPAASSVVIAATNGTSAASGGGSAAVRPPLQISEKTWPNGRLFIRENYYLADGGRRRVLHGVRTTWHDNGEKASEDTYKDGKLDGPSVRWRTDGKKEVEGAWQDDREEGVWTWWQPTGDLHSRCIYRNGHIVGRKTYWNAAGTVIREEDYDDGGHPVETRAYHGNGRPEMVGHFGRGWFNRGRKHGRWTYWDLEGNVVADGEWHNGRPWNGVCAIPAAGDAGSMFGVEKFWRFEDGRKLEPLPDLDPSK